jgi:hypothetical protein
VISCRANAEAEVLVPYPPIAQLGVIGDRRTAAVVGADGMVHWLCFPNYDGIPIFGSFSIRAEADIGDWDRQI